MKKFLSLMLAAVMLLGCLPAMAEEFPELDSSAGIISATGLAYPAWT